MRSSAAMSNRMLERPPPRWARARDGDDAQTRVSNTLVDLRTTVTDLDPKRADLTGVKKVLKWLPGGDKIDRYFAKYQSAQSHLNAIIKALESGQDELRKDNAAIETEKANMWATMGKLARVQRARRRPRRRDRGQGRRARGGGPHRGRQHAALRRAVPGPAAPAGHHDPDGGQRSGLHGARPHPQEQPRAHPRRRPGPDHDDRRAAHRGHRRPRPWPGRSSSWTRSTRSTRSPRTSSSRPPSSSRRRAPRSTSRPRAPPSTSPSCRRRSTTCSPPWTPSTRSARRRSTRWRRPSHALEGQIQRARPYLERTARGRSELTGS